MSALLIMLALVAGDADGCAEATKQVRYLSGYDHLVHVKNRCDHAIRCTVKTDVNKDGVTQQVPAKGDSTFMTWRGSPQSDFTWTISCEKSPQ